MSSTGPGPVPPIALPAWMTAAPRKVEPPAPAGPGKPGSPPQQRLTVKAIRDFLAKSALGREAVAFYDAHGISINFMSGKGASWDKIDNKINMHSYYSVEMAALVFVHEIHHARSSIDGPTGDPHTQSMDAYVATMLNEEVHATIAAIQVRWELNKAGEPPLTAPSESAYSEGRRTGVKRLLETNPDASPEERAQAGDKGGYDALMARFRNGDARSSRDGRSYVEVYETSWKNVQSTTPP